MFASFAPRPDTLCYVMPIPDSLQCANCGYDLTGHSRRSAGQCPECGQYFDRHSGEGIRGSQSPGTHQSEIDAKLARARTIALALLTVGIMGIGITISVTTPRTQTWIWALSLATVTGLAAATSYAYER